MEFPDRTDVDRLVDAPALPAFARVRYDPPTQTVEEPVADARAELDRLEFDHLDEGATIAVGAGSRGIHDIDAVVGAVVDELDERGFDPVIVPAMGSHGGATPEGQREVLDALGISEESTRAPIDARMETEQLGTVQVGTATMPVHFSVAALEADGVLVVNRVKPHTNYTGRVESGLTKMTVVGLGKQNGANVFHDTAIENGYVETLEAALPLLRDEVPLLGGVALVENFDERMAHVEAIPADAYLDREPPLLELAYQEMATLPVEDLDLLIVDEIGKDVSGAGMDTNVIGRYRVLNAPDPDTPDIDLIYVRGLTEETKHNGNGIGLADITRQSVVDELDLQKTYANALTSGSLDKSKLPIVAPDDELAIRIALSALGGYDPETARIVWLRNTEALGELRVSAPLIEELPDAATIEERERLSFDDWTASFEPE